MQVRCLSLGVNGILFGKRQEQWNLILLVFLWGFWGVLYFETLEWVKIKIEVKIIKMLVRKKKGEAGDELFKLHRDFGLSIAEGKKKI